MPSSQFSKNYFHLRLALRSIVFAAIKNEFQFIMNIAIYPGSFDPITNGHLDVLNRAYEFFDKIFE